MTEVRQRSEVPKVGVGELLEELDIVPLPLPPQAQAQVQGLRK